MYELRYPAPALAPYIENYWFVSSRPEAPVDLRVDVFVDARADLVFNFGVPYVREVIGGASRELSASNLDAQRLEPIRIRQAGDVHIAGVRFQLGGLGAFAAVPLSGVTGATVPPAQVLGPSAGDLDAALRAAPTTDARARLLDAFFLERLEERGPRGAFATFERALRAAVEAEGNYSVADLAEPARVTPRQVDRLFARFLGVAPKTLGRVLRFQHALRMLMRDPGCTLAEVAASAGYFDQAHFIKDFRRMSGGVPRGYRGYYPQQGPEDFAPNVVVFLQDDPADLALGDGLARREHDDTTSTEARETTHGEALVGPGDER